MWSDEIRNRLHVYQSVDLVFQSDSFNVSRVTPSPCFTHHTCATLVLITVINVACKYSRLESLASFETSQLLKQK